MQNALDACPSADPLNRLIWAEAGTSKLACVSDLDGRLVVSILEFSHAYQTDDVPSSGFQEFWDGRRWELIDGEYVPTARLDAAGRGNTSVKDCADLHDIVARQGA